MIERAEIKADAKSQIQGKIGALLIIRVLLMVVMAALSATVIGTFVLGGAFVLAISGIFLRVAQGGDRPEPHDLFATMNYDGISRGFLATLRYSVFVWLWGLLFVIPGIVKAIEYSQMFYLLADEPNMSARDAQKQSMELMRGHRGEYFVLMLSFLGWEILSVFTLGFLQIWLVPYLSTTLANYYLKLTESADKKPAASASTLA